MANVEPYLRAAAIGLDAADVTGDPKSAFKAGGSAAWIQSVTGSPPKTKALPGGRFRLYLTTKQKEAMGQWLDSQIHSAIFAKGAPPKVEVELGPVFKPWAMKYVIPAFIGAAVIGWMGHYAISR